MGRLSPADFHTVYGFRRPRGEAIGGLTPSLRSGLSLHPPPEDPELRCCPSSLYTFPVVVPPGLARDCHLRFPEFEAAMSPIEALRAWMLLFVDWIATKQIIASALNACVGGPSKLYEGSRAQIQGAIDALVKRAIKNRDMRRDLDPVDLLRALIGVSNVASGP
jgi:hypothetical protein